MSLTVTAGTKREPIPEGVHQAICTGLFDIGTQTMKLKDGKEKQVKQVVVTWEFPDLPFEFETDSGETKTGRKGTSKTYTASLNERSALYKMLISWRGKAFTKEELKGFNLRNILGKPCNIQIVHAQGSGANAGNTYANINNVMPAMKGQEASPLNEPVCFDMDEHGHGVYPLPESLMDWVKDRIQESEEFSNVVESSVEEPPESVVNNTADADEEEESPF